MHIMLLVDTSYEKQIATVRTSYGLSDLFQIGQSNRQDYILSYFFKYLCRIKISTILLIRKLSCSNNI